MSVFMLDPIVRRLREAEGFLELGLPKQALEVLRSRREWATVQFEASFLAGEALRELNLYREALVELEVAADLKPGSVGVAVALGWCYKRTHRLAQAIDALERARIVNPDHPLLNYNLACYWSLAGDIDQSLDALRRALDAEPALRLQAPMESDFDALRDQPEFTRLLSRD